MRLLLLALLAASPLVTQAAPDNRPVLIVVGMADEAKVAAGPGVTVVISAGNSAILRERLRAYSRANVRAVISFGVAGGLDPAGKPGDLYLSSRVVAKGASWTADPTLSRWLLKGARGAGLNVRRSADAGVDGLSVITPQERAKFHRLSGADIVDNESHVAAAFAASEGLPFAVVRAISDGADFMLPPAALLPLKPDGTPDGTAILKSLGQHPEQLGALIKTAVDEGKAISTLRRLRRHL